MVVCSFGAIVIALSVPLEGLLVDIQMQNTYFTVTL